MKRLICLTVLSVTACASAPSDSALCGATDRARTQLAAALVEDGGPQSQRAGLVLIEGIDAGCGQ